MCPLALHSPPRRVALGIPGDLFVSRRTRRKLRPVAVKGGIADVYIEGVIGKGKDQVSAAMVREQIAAAAGATELRVHINSEGGSVTEGGAIYNALRAFQGRKVAIVEGLAASMASVILMACDERVVSKGSFVMIHNPSGGAEGEAKDLRSTADLLDKMRGELLDIYESATDIERGELEKMLDAETYFTAEEAVEAGIADRVEGGMTASIKLDAVARLNPSKLPEALRALAQKESTMTAEEEKEMRAKMKALEEENAKLKAKAEEDGDDGEEEEPSDEDDKPEHDTHASEDDDKDAKALARDVLRLTGAKSVGEARGRIVALAHKAGAAGLSARATEVTALIEAGKLSPARKQWALKASAETFGAYCDAVKDIAPATGKQHKEPDAKGAPDKATETERRMAKLLGRSEKDIIASRGAEVRVGLRNLNEDN